jgi:Family of unknown function (DUF6263)
MKYIFLLFFGCTNFAYGQYTLALNLEKGDTYFLKINAINHFSGEIDGKKMAMNAAMTGTMKFKVVKVSAIDYELEASYDTLHITLKGPMGQMEFSAGNSSQDSDFISGPLNIMVSKHINITLLKNGAVSKIDNPDTSGFSAMLKNFPMAQGMKQMMMGHFKKSFSREAMKENMEKFTAIFPNKKVGLNESWGSVIKSDSGSDTTIKTSYQLVSYQSGIAIIKGHTESHSASKASSAQKQPYGLGFMFPVISDLEGESESTIQVSTATGWIKDATFKNEMKGHIQIKGTPDKQAKAGPVHMDSDITISSY